MASSVWLIIAHSAPVALADLHPTDAHTVANDAGSLHTIVKFPHQICRASLRASLPADVRLVEPLRRVRIGRRSYSINAHTPSAQIVANSIVRDTTARSGVLAYVTDEAQEDALCALLHPQLAHLSRRLGAARDALEHSLPSTAPLAERVDAAARRLDGCERVLGFLEAVIGREASPSF